MDTSAYWRKLLRSDEPVDLEAVKKCRTHFKLLRPFFFAIFKLVSRLFFPVTLEGAENLPERGAYIVAPNHVSILDYPSVICRLPRQIRDELFPVASKAYYDNPVAFFFMAMAANVIRIDTEDDFFSALKAAANVLKAGHAVFLFPEGTRSKSGELLPFKNGLGILSIEQNVPIVPVHVNGTYDVLPPKKIWFNRGKISVIIGQPVYPEKYILKKKSMQAYDVYKELTEEIRNKVLELRNRGDQR
ncbi:MAG: lysophospholipid acyltransferase family protein [Candidatus Margulisiibacteriota bacterium]|nr:1-acyl-sn-glycerol-3-phosphate acyltransferase [Candidatus Margulisiibacteriota bacterium]